MAAQDRTGSPARRSALRVGQGAVLALGLVLTGCAQTPQGGPEPEPEPTPEVQSPPDREIETAPLVAGAMLPVWGHSGACREPRPQPGQDGLVTTAPAPDPEDVQFYVPSAEITICGLPGVRAASVGGSYDSTGGVRDGAADVEILLEADATAQQIDGAWRTGAAEASAALEPTGLSLESTTLMLGDGSRVSGPAEDLSAGGSAAPGTAQALSVLEGLRSGADQDPAQDPDAEPGAPAQSATGQPQPGQAQLPPELDQAPRRWVVEAGGDLVVTTVIGVDVSDPGVPQLIGSALRTSQAQAAQSPTGYGTAVPRQDRVLIIDDRLQLTAGPGQHRLLPQPVREDLDALAQVLDLRVRAEIRQAATGTPVLRVRSAPILDYREPDIGPAVDRLRDSASAAGLELDHELAEQPL